MSKDLTKLRQQKRKTDQRVTKENKQSIINQINKYNSQNENYVKISKKASVVEVTRMKKIYNENLTRDIVTLAILEGKDIIAEIESRDLKKSEDNETKRLGEFGKQLAKAKKEADKKLTTQQKNFLESGNMNIMGFGNKDMITMFEGTRTKGQAQKMIDEIKMENPKDEFYNKQLGVFEHVFQKIELTREEDLAKIKERIRKMDMQDAVSYTNDLIQSLEIYGSPDNKIGQWNGDEKELANARLDDMLVRLGEKPTASNKQIKKTLNKYKSEYNEKSGFIYE
jgi:hypothetical protein